jgi:uncharacterized protein
MPTPFPHFRYHPDPIGNGLITVSATVCVCCNRARGYIYRGPVYAVQELNEQLCPWCIASGAAATKFGATFTDEESLLANGDLGPGTVEEITKRTPGYIGWQQETWLTHCNDACAYDGFPTNAELDGDLSEAVATLVDDLGISSRDWQMMRKAYVPGVFQPQGHVGLYKFICLRCGTVVLASDSN